MQRTILSACIFKQTNTDRQTNTQKLAVKWNRCWTIVRTWQLPVQFLRLMGSAQNLVFRGSLTQPDTHTNKQTHTHTQTYSHFTRNVIDVKTTARARQPPCSHPPIFMGNSSTTLWSSRCVILPITFPRHQPSDSWCLFPGILCRLILPSCIKTILVTYMRQADTEKRTHVTILYFWEILQNQFHQQNLT